MNYPLFNKDSKLNTLRNRLHDRKILQDVLVEKRYRSLSYRPVVE